MNYPISRRKFFQTKTFIAGLGLLLPTVSCKSNALTKSINPTITPDARKISPRESSGSSSSHSYLPTIDVVVVGVAAQAIQARLRTHPITDVNVQFVPVDAKSTPSLDCLFDPLTRSEIFSCGEISNEVKHVRFVAADVSNATEIEIASEISRRARGNGDFTIGILFVPTTDRMGNEGSQAAWIQPAFSSSVDSVIVIPVSVSSSNSGYSDAAQLLFDVVDRIAGHLRTDPRLRLYDGLLDWMRAAGPIRIGRGVAQGKSAERYATERALSSSSLEGVRRFLVSEAFILIKCASGTFKLSKAKCVKEIVKRKVSYHGTCTYDRVRDVGSDDVWDITVMLSLSTSGCTTTPGAVTTHPSTCQL